MSLLNLSRALDEAVVHIAYLEGVSFTERDELWNALHPTRLLRAGNKEYGGSDVTHVILSSP